jgi:hypothetical protein
LLDDPAATYKKSGTTEAAMQSASWTSGGDGARDYATDKHMTAKVWDLNSHIAVGTYISKIEAYTAIPLSGGKTIFVGWLFADNATPDNDWAWVTSANDTEYATSGIFNPHILAVTAASQRYLWLFVRFNGYTGSNITGGGPNARPSITI